MISVAVVDDDIPFVGSLETAVSQYFVGRKEAFKISPFYGGQSFIEAAKKETFDILFLDIMLGEECGISVGEKLRSIDSLNETEIIYISSIEKYTRELIKTRPTEYLKKPVQFYEIKAVLDNSLERITKRGRSITVSYNRDQYKIRIAEIRFVESQGRKCIIHTESGSIECYIKLKDILNQIGDTSFVQVHKSFVVNFDHVIHYSYIEVTLDTEDANGAKQVLTISQSFRKDVRSRYLQFMHGDIE